MKRVSFRSLGLVALGGVLALTLQSTPAVGSIGSWAHNWKVHIKPRTDKRYYTKAASDQKYLSLASTLRPGQLETGAFAASGDDTSSLISTAVAFSPKLPFPIAHDNAHYLAPDETSAECPGPGDAAVGHLCFYAGWAFAVTLNNIQSLTDSSSDAPITVEGAALLFTPDSGFANVRGVWAVRAPTAPPPPPAP